MNCNYVPWEEAPYTAANRKRREAEARKRQEELERRELGSGDTTPQMGSSNQKQDYRAIHVSAL